MKFSTTSQRESRWWLGASLLGVFAVFVAISVSAAETIAPPPTATGTNPATAIATTNAPTASPEPLTPEQTFEGGTNAYSNWIDLGVGGLWTGGNKAQAQALRHASRGAFGGIEDFRYQKTIDKSTLTIDGRALFDQ